VCIGIGAGHLALFLFVCMGAAEDPWISSFSAVRTVPVSDEKDLSKAIDKAKAGDLIELDAGNYQGFFKLSKKGSAEKPIVLRAKKGTHVTIEGAIFLQGDYTWIWDLEVTDPHNVASEKGPNGAVTLGCQGCRIINCVIHNPADFVTRFKNNISNYGTYNKPEQVLYGNIVFQGRHNIYTQHDYAKGGFEYLANNVFVNPQQKPGAADAFTFHAFGSKDVHLSGYYLKSNIFNGRMLIGGAGYPVSNIIAENNEYYASTPQFGYAKNGISQYKFKNNFVSRSTLEVQHTWGADDPNFTQEANTEITGNSIVYPANGKHIKFQTTDSNGCLGCPKLNSADKVDGNYYSKPFSFLFVANKKNVAGSTLVKWKKVSEAAGNAYDADSSEIENPTEPRIVIYPNAYDPDRAHFVVYNWNKSKTHVDVNLTTVLKPGQFFEVYDYRNIWSNPAVTGQFKGDAVSIPTPDEFNIFVVRIKTGPGPQTQTSKNQ
jgi:Chondroitinase B